MASHQSQDPWYANWFDTKYYHILYKNRDYSEAAQFMNNITRSLDLSYSAHILDLACGRGRHSTYLNQLGYRVTGVDLSENSIAFAKARLQQLQQQETTSFFDPKKVDASRLNFEVHDMTRPMDMQFDAIFNLFTSFGYFEDDADNLKTIKSIRESLKPGGKAVIDFMNAHYVVKNLVASNSKTIEGIEFKMTRRLEEDFIVKEIKFTDEGKDFHFVERVKAMPLSEFQTYFHQAGLELLDVYGDYNLGDYNQNNSQRLIMMVR